MSKFHISADGIARPCKAKGICPLGGAEAHFDNIEEAEKVATTIMEKKYGMLRVVGENKELSDDIREALDYYEVGGDLSALEFVNDFEDRYGEYSPGEREDIAREIAQAYWDANPKADLDKVPKVKDYIVSGEHMLATTALHREYKEHPRKFTNEEQRYKDSGATTVAHHVYKETLEKYGIELDDDVDVNIYAIEDGKMDIPIDSYGIGDAKAFEDSWDGKTAAEVLDKYGTLTTRTRQRFYEEDVADLEEGARVLRDNMHKPFDEWEDKPETLAIQNEDGTVSVYDVEYYDTNKLNEHNNVRFRGNPEKVGLKMFTKADTYTGVRAEELIKADLVYCDI